MSASRSTSLLDCATAGESRLTVEAGIPVPPVTSIIERKGLGHPDTLADHLAEELSRAYAAYTRDTVGAILHHNFDKLALLGGSSRVAFGGGAMTSPVRVLVNGRATHRCGSVSIPVDDIVTETVRRFLHRRLPHLANNYTVELNVTANSSPGAVHSHSGQPERASWFSPASVEQLRERAVLLANDTSLGTGWAPLNEVETFVIMLADNLSGPSDFTETRPWCGSDVKVMALADEERVDVTFCGGLITPLRPMNLEGVSGKNPVYHVGKLYNIAARRIAVAIQEQFGGYVEVHLISATGQALASPWQAVIRTSNRHVDHEEVERRTREVLDRFPVLTEDLVAGREQTA